MSQPRLPYRSTLREEQARATQRVVVSAARDLFVELGWSRTSIDAVAARAEVSRRTVFTSVGGKAALLKLALDWALVGDDEPVPMSERPVIAEMERLTDPRALVARWAQFVAELEERAAPLAAVLVVAADVDPVAAAVHAESERNPARGRSIHRDPSRGNRRAATGSHHRTRCGRHLGADGPCRPPHARARARLDAPRVRQLDRAHGHGRAPQGHLEGGMTDGVLTIGQTK